MVEVNLNKLVFIEDDENLVSFTMEEAQEVLDKLVELLKPKVPEAQPTYRSYEVNLGKVINKGMVPRSDAGFLSRTPILHINDIRTDWDDDVDRPWICRSAVKKYVPAISGSIHIKLEAYDRPYPGRVPVRLDPNPPGDHPIMVDNLHVDSFPVFQDWIDVLCHEVVYVTAVIA